VSPEKRSTSTPASTSPRAEPATGAPRRAVFLDRDGTIIEDRNYLSDPAGIRLIPGAAAAIARLNRAGLPVVIVTNQSGIGRGYFSSDDYHRVERRLDELLRSAGARVTATYHCPHAPGVAVPCECRKPAPGLFERAARENGLDLASSFYVGDRLRDVRAGLDHGGTAFLLRGLEEGAEVIHPGIHLVDSLAEAVDRLLQRLGID
jgi:D-glycero-D-manno-heptose 1,7-bisphosphate phosphatase